MRMAVGFSSHLAADPLRCAQRRRRIDECSIRATLLARPPSARHGRPVRMSLLRAFLLAGAIALVCVVTVVVLTASRGPAVGAAPPTTTLPASSYTEPSVAEPDATAAAGQKGAGSAPPLEGGTVGDSPSGSSEDTVPPSASATSTSSVPSTTSAPSGSTPATVRPGALVFRPPSPMRQGEWQHISVAVADAINITAARSQLGAPGQQLSESSIPVGYHMRADLTGPDFTITRAEKGDGDRRLDPVSGAQNVAGWQWDVQPTASGTRSMTLTVSVISDDTGQPPTWVSYQSLPIDVTFDLGFWFGQFVRTYWVATGLSVPVVMAGVLWLARGVRRRRDRSSGDGPRGPVEREEVRGYL